MFNALVLFLLVFSKMAYSQENSLNFSLIDNPSNVSGKEIELLDELVTAAQENIKNLTFLKDLVTNYQAEQSRYMENSNDSEALYKMIKFSYVILENIKALQLTPLFEPSFLSELAIISKPAAKLGIPRP
jgi:hypothetical protein